MTELLAKEWAWLDGHPCPGAKPGEYFEVSGEEKSVELYVVSDSRALASEETLPPEPFFCSKIPAPTFIKEI